MRQWTRKLLLVVILVSVGGVAYKVGESIWLSWLDQATQNPTKILNYLPEAAVQIKDFHRTNFEGDRKVWEILGDEARYFKKNAEATIENPRFTFYAQDGKTMRASAQQGRLFFLDQEIDKIELEGDIEIRYQDFILHTERMSFVKRDDQVVVPGWVQVLGDGLELEGVGMEVDLGTEKLRLLKQVRTKLRADRLEKRRTSTGDRNASVS